MEKGYLVISASRIRRGSCVTKSVKLREYKFQDSSWLNRLISSFLVPVF